MFVYIKAWFLSKVGHFGSQTRSLGQILVKPCEHDRDYIFIQIVIKLGQNVCLHKQLGSFRKWVISDEKLGHQVKSQKNLVNTIETTFLTQSSSNLVRMFVYIKAWFLSKVGHFGSQTRSLGQILVKPCEHDRDYIFIQIVIKLGQNVCLHKHLVPFESGSFRMKNQVTRSNLRKTL